MDEKCSLQLQHCTCVPLLRMRVKELETLLEIADGTNRAVVERMFELKAANAKYKSALENIIIWAKGSTCEMCGVKEMTETDAYDIASEALKED